MPWFLRKLAFDLTLLNVIAYLRPVSRSFLQARHGEYRIFVTPVPLYLSVEGQLWLGHTFHFDVLIHLLKENEIFLLGVPPSALPSNIFQADPQYFVHLVCVLSPFAAADQTVLSPRISRHKICLGHKLIEFDFFRALSLLMKMSFRRATTSSPKKLETKAYFPRLSPIWWQVIMRSQGPASHAAIIDCYFLFLTRPGSDYWLALSLINWLLLKPPAKSLLILMLLFKLMLNESVDVWRQIGDSLELDNSLTTALPKFVTFGQSLFIVCL